MADEVVVDASVAVAWFMREHDWKAARAVLERGALMIAPDLMFIEFASASVKRVWRGDVSTASADAALDQLAQLLDEVVASPALTSSALHLAADLRCSAYDALYLALAHSRSARMITADFKFADKVESAGLGRLVERLGV